MPKIRLAVAGLVAAASVFSAAPAGAAYEYVTVTHENGVIGVSTQLPGQPLVGAFVDTKTGLVCVGFSYQVPFCRTLPLDAISIQDPFDGQPPLVVDTDASDGSVGVYTQLPGQPLVGVRYETANARLCVGFSYQIPFCIQLGPIS
jgi:hypothetical protein